MSTDFEEKPVVSSSNCPICQKSYGFADISSLRTPLILDCNHSCCEGCIRESLFTSKKIVCRKCGSRSIPKQSIDLTAKNLRDIFPVAKSIIHEMRAFDKPKIKDDSQINFSFDPQPRKNPSVMPPSPNKLLCEECSVGHGAFKCVECKAYLCVPCEFTTHKSNILRNHKRIQIDDVSVGGSYSSAHYVGELEQGHILEQMCARSQSKIAQVEKSMTRLSDKTKLYESPINYDKIEHDLEDYFERTLNAVSKKKHELIKALNVAKNSWKISSRNCERELSALLTNLNSTSNRLHNIIKLNSRDKMVAVSEHLKHISELLEKPDSLVTEYPRRPGKEFKLSYNWIKLMEEECDFDFGSSGEAYLSKSEDPIGEEPRKMMHPQYDYSDNDYDFSSVPLSPGEYHSRASSEFSPFPNLDAVETRSASSYQSSTYAVRSEVLSSTTNSQASVSKKKSVASQISSSASSAASCSRNGYTNAAPAPPSRPQKSMTICSNKSNFVKTSFSNENADLKKELFMILERFRRNISSAQTFRNVRVTRVVNPTYFYVQPQNVKEFFEKLAEEFEGAASWPHVTLNEIPKDTMCITVGSRNQRHRVRVMGHGKDEGKETLVNVLFVDTGNEGEVPLSELRLPKHGMKKRIVEGIPLASLCGLYDCFPKKGCVWKNDAIDKFQSCIENSKLDMEVRKRTPNKYEVDLIAQGTFSKSVRQLLLDAGKASVCSQSHKIVPTFCKEPSFLYDKDFQDWIHVKVSHIQTPGLFYAQRSDAEKRTLIDLSKRMNAFYRNDGNYNAAEILNPVAGQIIAAKYLSDKQWYRAVIQKVDASKNKFFVKYVDYGNGDWLRSGDIRMLSHEFYKFTVQAFQCSLRDILPLNGVWQDSALKLFKKLVDGIILTMVVNDTKEDGSLSVSLYKTMNQFNQTDSISIQKMLIQRGVARGVGENAGIKAIVKQKRKAQKGKGDRRNNDGESSDPIMTSSTSRFDTGTDDHSSVVLDLEPFDTEDKKEDGLKRRPPSKMSEVKMVSFFNPNKMFLHFIERCPNVTNITTDLGIFFGDMKNKESMEVESVVVNQKYAVYSEDDSKWYRGVVKDCLDDDQVEVNLIDFVETTVTVNKDNIRSLPEQFMKDVDAVLKSALVGFEEREDWSPEFCKAVNQEMTKYKELWVESRGRRESDPNILNVVLWGRNVRCSGPLDPMVEKWTDLNSKFLRMEKNEDATSSGSSGKGYEPYMEYVRMLDEESDSPDPSVTVCKWLTDSLRASGNGTNYSDLVNNRASGDADAESDDTIELDDENLDSISIIAQEADDWLDPPALDITHFTGKVTHIDWDFNMYIQITERSHSTLDVIKSGLKSVFENSKAKPDDLYWRPGQICMALWLDRDWHRARVKAVNNNEKTAEVEYVDFGSDAWIPVTSMRKKTPLLDIPIQCYKIPQRSDIIPASEDKKWPKKVLDFIHMTVVDKNCNITLWKEPGENFYRVEKLITLDTGRDIYDLLKSLAHAVQLKDAFQKKPMEQLKEETEMDEDESSESSSDSSVSAIERIPDQKKLLKELKEDFEEAKAPINPWTVPQTTNDNTMIVSYYDVPESVTSLKVKVTEVLSVTEIVINVVSSDDNPGIEESYKLYQKMTEELQKEASQFPNLNPPYLNQICCTLFEDGIWYRGLVLHRSNVNPNNVLVFYIDYGNVADTPISELRVLKKDWYHIPMQSIKCVISDIVIPDSKSEIERFGDNLSNNLLNKEFTAILKELQPDERLYSIRLLDEDDVPPYRINLKP